MGGRAQRAARRRGNRYGRIAGAAAGRGERVCVRTTRGSEPGERTPVARATTARLRLVAAVDSICAVRANERAREQA